MSTTGEQENHAMVTPLMPPDTSPVTGMLLFFVLGIMMS